MFGTDVGAFVIADVRRLGDLALTLLGARPVLYVLNDARDMPHYRALLHHRLIVQTPFDAVLDPSGNVHGDRWLTLQFADLFVRGDAAITVLPPFGGAPFIPATLAPFARLTKARLMEFARRSAILPLPRVQHFWRPVGDVGAMAPLLMNTQAMTRAGVGGTFDAMTPTLLVVDPAALDELGTVRLGQSTTIVAPFALPAGTPVDHLLADFSDARDEPFHLHHLEVIGVVDEATIGCFYAEYMV